LGTSEFCENRGCPFGTFDPSQSTTYVQTGKDLFDIKYADGSTIHGDYATETVSIGGAEIANLTIAVATDIEDISDLGIIGISFDIGESIGASGGKPYPNIISQMVAQGIIATRAYSLWLNDIGSSCHLHFWY
jgi:Eukaryotic aspartyl protease